MKSDSVFLCHSCKSKLKLLSKAMYIISTWIFFQNKSLKTIKLSSHVACPIITLALQSRYTQTISRNKFINSNLKRQGSSIHIMFNLYEALNHTSMLIHITQHNSHLFLSLKHLVIHQLK